MSGRRNIDRTGYFEDEGVQPAPLPDGFLETLSPATLDNVGYGGQALPVIRQADGTVQIGNFHLSATGLVVSAEVTRDEWEAFYRGIQKVRRALQWIVGDWLLYGFDRNWTVSYAQMAELTGLRPSTVQDYTNICLKIPPAMRIAELTFAHFQIIAGLPEDKRQEWINKAVKHKYSSRQLRAAINGEQQTDAPPLLDKSNKRRMDRIWRNLSQGTLDRIHSDDIYEMRKWLDKAEALLRK